MRAKNVHAQLLKNINKPKIIWPWPDKAVTLHRKESTKVVRTSFEQSQKIFYALISTDLNWTKD